MWYVLLTVKVPWSQHPEACTLKINERTNTQGHCEHWGVATGWFALESYSPVSRWSTAVFRIIALSLHQAEMKRAHSPVSMEQFITWYIGYNQRLPGITPIVISPIGSTSSLFFPSHCEMAFGGSSGHLVNTADLLEMVSQEMYTNGGARVEHSGTKNGPLVVLLSDSPH